MKIADLLRLDEQSQIGNDYNNRTLNQQTVRDAETKRNNIVNNEINRGNLGVSQGNLNVNRANATTTALNAQTNASKLRMEEKSEGYRIAGLQAQALGNVGDAKLKFAQAQQLNEKLRMFGETQDPKYLLGNAGTKNIDPAYRLRGNDALEAEKVIVDKIGGIDAETFSVLNNKFLANTPDDTNYFYSWVGEYWGGDNARQVRLGKGKTMRDVRRKAAELGMSVAEVLSDIEKDMKRKE